MTPEKTRAQSSTYNPPYTTSSTLAPAEPISSHPRGTTRPEGRTSASASRPPTTFANVAARATSTGSAPPRRANCSTYPPIVLTRACPPSAQYRLISAQASATIAAAYAVTVPTAGQPEAAGVDCPLSAPVLPIMLQYRRPDFGAGTSAPTSTAAHPHPATRRLDSLHNHS